jgi:hypothetical protein
MNKSDKVIEKARAMDWQTATAIVSRAVELHASKTAADGQFSREAVDKAAEIQAAWQRIQRG